MVLKTTTSSVSDAVSSFFKFLTKKKETQTEDVLLERLERLEKANRYAEQYILFNEQTYTHQDKRLWKFKQKFFEYN